jgi:hypothetical protein
VSKKKVRLLVYVKIEEKNTLALTLIGNRKQNFSGIKSVTIYSVN